MSALTMRRPLLHYIAGVLVLAAAYYGAAKLGQTLRYTASVSAIWPPAGLGIAALYLWGLRWWPGIFLGGPPRQRPGPAGPPRRPARRPGRRRGGRPARDQCRGGAPGTPHGRRARARR